MNPRNLPALASATPLSLAVPFLSPQPAHPGLSLAQVIAILRAWRRESLLIAGSIVLLAAVGCWLWPRTWEATATLMVDFEVNDPLSGREFPTGLLGSYMATQVELARGPQVLDRVIERLKLADDEAYTGGFSGSPEELRGRLESKLGKKLTVEQGKYGSQLINVTFSATGAAEAARIANAVAEVYADQQHLRQTGPAADRAQRYTAQLAELKGKVSHAQEEVTAFRQRSGLIDSDQKGDVSMLMLSTLETRLLEAQNVRRAAEARASVDAAVGSQVLASPMIQSLKSQLAQESAQLAQLRTTLGPRHPQILELTSQIAVTRGALDAELRTYTGNAAAELASARQLEQKLEVALAEQRAAVLRVRQLQDQGAKQQLELESAQSVYKRALEGYDQVMFASNGGYTNIGFVSHATPPPRPTHPKVMLVMLLASVFGAALGLAAPLGYELLHRRVRCRDDVERDHGIPVLMEFGPIQLGRPSGGPQALVAS